MKNCKKYELIESIVVYMNRSIHPGCNTNMPKPINELIDFFSKLN